MTPRCIIYIPTSSFKSLSNDAICYYTYPKALGIPGYKWMHNSCWIDTSMQLLYTALHCNWHDFALAFQDLPTGDPIWYFFSAFSQRHMLEREEDWKNIQSSLMTHGNDLRNSLFQTGSILPSGKKFDAFFTSFISLLAPTLPSEITDWFSTGWITS